MSLLATWEGPKKFLNLPIAIAFNTGLKLAKTDCSLSTGVGVGDLLHNTLCYGSKTHALWEKRYFKISCLILEIDRVLTIDTLRVRNINKISFSRPPSKDLVNKEL